MTGNLADTLNVLTMVHKNQPENIDSMIDVLCVAHGMSADDLRSAFYGSPQMLSVKIDTARPAVKAYLTAKVAVDRLYSVAMATLQHEHDQNVLLLKTQRADDLTSAGIPETDHDLVIREFSNLTKEVGHIDSTKHGQPTLVNKIGRSGGNGRTKNRWRLGETYTPGEKSYHRGWVLELDQTCLRVWQTAYDADGLPTRKAHEVTLPYVMQSDGKTPDLPHTCGAATLYAIATHRYHEQWHTKFATLTRDQIDQINAGRLSGQELANWLNQNPKPCRLITWSAPDFWNAPKEERRAA